jgi:cold shock CspA family protein
MLDRGLCLSYDPTVKTIAKTVKLEISPSGQQHLSWGLQDWIYIESMAEITPLHDAETAKHVRTTLSDGGAHHRRSAVSSFIAYLLLEDSQLCVIPAHAIYEEQKDVRIALTRQSSALSAAASVATVGRYRRHLGRVTSWKLDRGFGFVRPSNGGPNVFLHISEVLNAEGGIVPEGAAVDFDIVEKPQGSTAVDAVLLT